jgi:hypothetical protein
MGIDPDDATRVVAERRSAKVAKDAKNAKATGGGAGRSLRVDISMRDRVE